ncbi:MAG: hypothetical protein E4G90_08585 [Gemmatimonadales bacterium]|nr:MAG: hypothetical protein E4G90_08585 [Gemmatimonadales bacterium]
MATAALPNRPDGQDLRCLSPGLSLGEHQYWEVHGLGLDLSRLDGGRYELEVSVELQTRRTPSLPDGR